MCEHMPPTKRQCMADEEVSINLLPKDELIKKCIEQQTRIELHESKLNNNSEDNINEKSKGTGETSRRENVLLMRLANKEQEVQEYMAQINHSKKVQEDAALLSLQQTNLDPGINLLFGKMREDLQQTKDKLEQAQSELSAWKFTPDSQNGKKLISRCRTLIAENRELERQLSQGKTAHLEAELALQKKYTEELKASQDEMNEFVIQLDEEVEDMQNSIQVLQQQLLSAKAENEEYKKIIDTYKSELELEDDDNLSEVIEKHAEREYSDEDASIVSDGNSEIYNEIALETADYEQTSDLSLNYDDAALTRTKSDGSYSECDSDIEPNRASQDVIITEGTGSPASSNSLKDNGRTRSYSATPTRDDFDNSNVEVNDNIHKILERTNRSNTNEENVDITDEKDINSSEPTSNGSGDEIMACINTQNDNSDQLLHVAKNRKKSLSEEHKKATSKTLSEDEEIYCDGKARDMHFDSPVESDRSEMQKSSSVERSHTSKKPTDSASDVFTDQAALLAQCNRLLAQALPGSLTDQDMLADLSRKVSDFTKANHDNLDLHSLELVQKTIKRLLAPSSKSPPSKDSSIKKPRRTSILSNHSLDVAASQNGTEEKSD